MTSLPARAIPEKTPPPCDDLYIYYLQGRVTDAGRFFPEPGFIGNWQEEDTAFLFFDRPSLEPVRRMAAAHPGLKLLDQYHMTYRDWQGGALTAFREGRFTVHPAWADPEATPESPFTLRLDPGVVFGAGTHPTTRDCLGLLDRLFEREQIGSALDLGTGTGLLALGAVRLGCRRVLAVDLNLLSVQTARNNIRLNGMETAALPVQGRAEALIDCPADLVIANIHYDVMKDLIRSRGFQRKRWFILSGLLRSEARAVEERLARCSARILEKRTRDDVWSTYLGTMPAAAGITPAKGWG